MKRTLVRGARLELDAVAAFRFIDRLLKVATRRHTNRATGRLQRRNIDRRARRLRCVRFRRVGDVRHEQRRGDDKGLPGLNHDAPSERARGASRQTAHTKTRALA